MMIDRFQCGLFMKPLTYNILPLLTLIFCEKSNEKMAFDTPGIVKILFFSCTDLNAYILYMSV